MTGSTDEPDCWVVHVLICIISQYAILPYLMSKISPKLISDTIEKQRDGAPSKSLKKT